MSQGNVTVYSASAGSGKTFTLAASYIARLLAADGTTFRNLLAVTFTNKAATEMKQRILQRLHDLWRRRDTPAARSFRQAVREMMGKEAPDDETMARRAGEALRQILHDYDRFSVGTIDSFFQSLLSDLAHELGLPAGFKVDIDDKDVADKAVDRLLGRLDERADVRAWVLGYIKERIDENRRWDISREVKRLARNLLKEVFLLHDEALRDVLDREDVLRGYRRKLDALAGEARARLRDAARTLADEVDRDARGYQLFSRGGSLRTYVEGLAGGGTKEPSATVLKYMESPDNWLRKADRADASLTRRAERLRLLLVPLEELRVRAMSVIHSCELSTRHLNPLRLLGAIGREMDAINEENNRFMLAKTPQLFDRLVGADDASFVFEKSGTRFRHVMIDEFQDTSALQWSNFRHLLVENMASGNGCLLVGDVKQGIYRFRNGDWRILAGIGRELGADRVDLRRLDTNFRSDARIVAFNNTFFTRAAAALDGLSAEAGDGLVRRLYADVAQRDCGKAGGYVRVEMAGRDKAGRRDGPEGGEPAPPVEESLARHIAALHEGGLPYGEMAVLVRYNRSAAALLDYFAEHHPHVPLVSDEAFLLSASPATQMLVHALRCLRDPSDTIARTYLADRYQRLVLRRRPDWEELTAGADDLLPPDFVRRRDELADTPLYELCERLIRMFRIDSMEGAAPYLFAFLDQLLAFLDENASGIEALLRHWEDTMSGKAIPSGEVEGVRILTIHKSKGLAFHTVMIPYCDWPLEKDRREDLLWCVPPAPPYDEVPLLPVDMGRDADHSVYSAAYREEHRQRRIENLNLLYVAFTRARRNLLVWCEGKEGLAADATAGDLVRLCVGPDAGDAQPGTDTYIYESGTPVTDSGATGDGNGRPPLGGGESDAADNPLEIRPQTEYAEFHAFEGRMDFRQSRASEEFLAVQDDTDERQARYIDQGKMLHRVFSAIRTVGDVAASLRELERQGLADSATTARLGKLISRRMADPLAASWFDGSWQLHNECGILSRDGDGRLQVRRPDRVMTKGREAVVVDFKFGVPRPGYRDQVREYMRLLSGMGYAPVRGFLWYVYSGETEPVDPAPA